MAFSLKGKGLSGRLHVEGEFVGRIQLGIFTKGKGPRERFVGKDTCRGKSLWEGYNLAFSLKGRVPGKGPREGFVGKDTA